MKRLALLALIAGLACLPQQADAKVVLPAKVRYQTESGLSAWVPTNVTVIAGMELNEATNSIRYSALHNYAVVFFTQHQAAVIELSNFMVCGATVEEWCLPAIGNLRGADTEGRPWEICTHDLC